VHSLVCVCSRSGAHSREGSAPWQAPFEKKIE